MKKNLVPLLIAGSALISGCDQGNAPATNSSPAATVAPAATATPATVVDKADAVAVVNGQYISKTALADLEKEISVRSQGKAFPKDKLIEELVQRQVLVQDALQKQLDKTPDVISQIENIKNTLLTKANLESYLKANPVTDAELKAEYDAKVGGSNNGTEYKASHILVKTEEEAKKLIAELDKGAKFADLANKHSLDGKDAKNGGDLGWFSPAQMVEPFSAAVAKLEKGKYTKEPVKTQFGYHIILNEDSRPQTPPPFDAVKEQMKPFLERKKVQAMVENLRKQAKVEILVPLDDKPAATEAAPAATPAAPAEKPATDAPASEAKPAATEKAAEPAAPVAAEPAAPATPAAVEPVAPAAPVAAEPAAKAPVEPVHEAGTPVEAAKDPAPAVEPAKEEAPARHQDTIPVKPEQKK